MPLALRRLLRLPFWSFPRGSLQYDAAVALVIAALFLLPFWVPTLRDGPSRKALRRSAAGIRTVAAGTYVVPLRKDLGETPDMIRERFSKLYPELEGRTREIVLRDQGDVVGLMFVVEPARGAYGR